MVCFFACDKNVTKPLIFESVLNVNNIGFIRHVVLGSLLITYNIYITPFSSVYIVNFEHGNVSWIENISYERGSHLPEGSCNPRENYSKCKL